MANKPETVGNGRWTLGKRLGAGSFGEIYVGEDATNLSKFAVKLEESSTKTPQLLTEAKILRHLRDIQGVPQIVWFGTEEPFNILVMTLLGPSLESVLNSALRHLSIRGVVQLAEELLQRLEDVHNHDYIHRDIKPDNFLLGKPGHADARTVFIIDFGLAKRYRDMKTKIHIPCKEEKPLIGTARYASLNTHLGFEQSRRDDLEALGYIFVYLQKGRLPWQGLPRSSRKDKYRGIMEAKMNTTLSILCKDLPTEFCSFLQYCRMLKFDEKPDYAYLKKLMRDVCASSKFTTVGKFDWELDASELQSETSSQRKQISRHRRKSVTLTARRPLLRENSKANRTFAATGDEMTTEQHKAIGPKMTEKAREMIKRIRRITPDPRPRSNCRVF